MTPLSQFEASWPAISALLDEALSLPAPEHASWLEGLVGERALHREALRALLAHQTQVETDDFLNALPRLDTADTAPSLGRLAACSSVGAYQLIAEIGQGGMGTVWLAERADGLMNRRVALKLPRIVWGDSFAERLAREREILATLEHEHIARLYDAGIDAHGRPFLAMEYVDGKPIDAYCRTHALPVRERVALLLQVMAAVSHAHSRLVVHRDLKPSNILVTGEAKVKLLDFGIAKLLEGDSTLRTALTELSGRALTLDYASPEQIRGEPLGTASDVYSMGVVAYELLAGARPYRLTRATAAELEEAIASVESPLASDSASDQRVARQLRGDLDSILNKALKKAASERYATMDAFAHDLQRHLDGAPVEARPDGLAYRTGKFVRRHRLQVAAGAVAAVALLVGSGLALWQAQEARLAAERASAEAAHARAESTRAQAEAATAKAVQGFIESVFNANSYYQADPKKGRATTARELLDHGAERVDKELASQPQAQLRMYRLLGDMYTHVADNEAAIVMFRRASDLATRRSGAGSNEALTAATSLGQTLSIVGQMDEALAVLQAADAAAGRRPVDNDAIRMDIETGLANLLFYTDLPRSYAHARRAGAIAQTQGPSEGAIEALRAVGMTALGMRRYEESRQALAEGLARAERLDASGVQAVLLPYLGQAEGALGHPEAARASLARAVALAERVGDATLVHNARYFLNSELLKTGHCRDALGPARIEADWALAGVNDTNDYLGPAYALLIYSRALTRCGDATQGLAFIDKALALVPPVATDGERGRFVMERVNALTALGRLGDAGAQIDRAFAMVNEAGGDFRETAGVIRRRYLVAVGKGDEALQDFRGHPPKDDADAPPVTQLARRTEEAALLLAAGHRDEARAAATAALAIVDVQADRDLFEEREARLTAVLGQALLQEGRAAEAVTMLRKSLALHVKVYGPVHSPAMVAVRSALAEAERRAGVSSSARPSTSG